MPHRNAGGRRGHHPCAARALDALASPKPMVKLCYGTIELVESVDEREVSHGQRDFGQRIQNGAPASANKARIQMSMGIWSYRFARCPVSPGSGTPGNCPGLVAPSGRRPGRRAGEHGTSS